MTPERHKAIEAILASPQNEAAGRRWGQRFEQQLQQRLQAFADSGQARKLYVAGQLGGIVSAPASVDAGMQPAQARAWLQAAVDARPRDALVARFEIDGCAGMGLRCDPAGALAFLLRQEPDNAEVQLRAVLDARRRGDRAAVERHWQDAASATRFQGGAALLGPALLEAYAGLDWPLPDARFSHILEQLRGHGLDLDLRAAALMEAQQVWASQGFEPGLLLQEMHGCRGEPAGSARWDECASVAALLAEDSSNLLVPMVGLKTLIELTAGMPEQEPWQQRLRRIQWLQQAAATETLGELMSAAMYAWVETMLRDGELAALRQQLARHGKAAEPPADWAPGDGPMLDAGGGVQITLPAGS
ncbi:MAG TPA: hypothetical protein DDZ67_05805 [Xanthomonadaceae bacterium]|nr:hypothetical protein [Xanthomonadaceae bacterium]